VSQPNRPPAERRQPRGVGPGAAERGGHPAGAEGRGGSGGRESGERTSGEGTSGDRESGRGAGAAAQLDAEARLRIGEAAAEAGVSTRTLRYYQELGLLTPAGTTAGGARRYSHTDVARIHRIRHLRDLVGLDLNEVSRVLAAEDRLAAIRREWLEGQTSARQRELVRESIAINAEVQEMARRKLAGLKDFTAGLEDLAARYRHKLDELEAADGGEQVLTGS